MYKDILYDFTLLKRVSKTKDIIAKLWLKVKSNNIFNYTVVLFVSPAISVTTLPSHLQTEIQTKKQLCNMLQSGISSLGANMTTVQINIKNSLRINIFTCISILVKFLLLIRFNTQQKVLF